MLKTKKNIESVDNLLDKLDSFEIRPFPRVVQQLSATLKNPGVKPSEVAKVVESDVALSARILRMANSPVCGVSNVIRTIEQATVVLGSSRLKNLAQTYAAAVMFAGAKNSKQHQQRLWDHCLGCACVARVLAKHLKTVDPDEAFLAGIFHDVGQIFFHETVPETYGKLVDAYSGIELVEQEQAAFGITHPEVGVKLAHTWQLPESLMVAVGFHHQPGNAIAHGSLVNIVHVANQLARSAGVGSEANPEIPVKESAAEFLQLTQHDLGGLQNQAALEYEATKQAYSG